MSKYGDFDFLPEEGAAYLQEGGEALEFDKQGSNWNDKIMPKDIFERTYDIGHFLLNHSHPIIEKIKPVVFSKYKVRMKFSIDCWPNAGSIWCNGRWLVCRKKKSSPVIFNKNVVLIEGTPTSGGGSNNYPVPTFKEGYCIIDFVSSGLPMTNRLSGWKSEIISLEPFSPTQPPAHDVPEAVRFAEWLQKTGWKFKHSFGWYDSDERYPKYFTTTEMFHVYKSQQP